MISHILLLTALPACLAQFSIQGPSDGHTQAQGLSFSEEKGIQYTGQNAGSGGNAGFSIQGATDGHSNFQIQGASSGGGSAHDRGQYRAPVIQPQYQQNSAGLSYKDPSGLSVNWKSYAGGRQQPSEPQYATAHPTPVRVPQPAPAHQARQRIPQPIPQRAPQHVEPQAVQQTRQPTKFIQQLLNMQQHIPYINAIPSHFRYDGNAHAQEQAQQIKHYFDDAARTFATQKPEVISVEYASHHRAQHSRAPRPKREAQHAPQRQQPQFAKSPAEPQITYSSNLPPQFQELLKFQASLPYDIAVNRVQFAPPKPYVPQAAQAPQYQQPIAAAQYQPAYTQAQIGQHQGQGVRPVKENQY